MSLFKIEQNKREWPKKVFSTDCVPFLAIDDVLNLSSKFEEALESISSYFA